MKKKLDKTWHLAESDAEVQVTEFESQLWRVFYGFLRWQEDCQSYTCHDDLNGYELALLHVIRMNDRPKTIYELSRLLNRDDPNNIQYGITKLLKKDLIKKADIETSKKAQSYQITAKGIKNTDEYCQARRQILIELFEGFGFDNLKLEEASKTLSIIKGIYDEASRLAALYKTDKSLISMQQEPEYCDK